MAANILKNHRRNPKTEVRGFICYKQVLLAPSFGEKKRATSKKK